MVEPFGYHGRILRVDLTTGSLRPDELDAETARLYGGGSLLAVRYLLRETPPGQDPFDPGALLVFASSVIAGQRAAGLPRFSLVAKSPLTGGVGEARAEGPFGVALKESGYDAILVRGRAEQPVYLLVADGEPALLSAEGLWGLDTYQATDRLQALHPGCHVATIGPAGERLVRYASVVTDRSFQAARTGLGAAMGSKQLKAVVLAGGSAPPVADPEGVEAITEDYRARQLLNPVTRWQHEPPGFGTWVAGATVGTFGVENYRTSVFDASGFEPDVFLQHLSWSEAGCPGCPNDCIKGFAATLEPDALAAGHRARTGGLHQEAAGALGPNLGMRRAETVLRLNESCQRLGLDPVSLGYTISFVMECRERGLLSPADLDGLDVRFGAEGALDPLIEWIAQRQGAGDWLAEGVRRAAVTLGPETAPFALHVKGLEMVGFDPRAMTNLGLGYATAPVGPRYEICEHDVDFDPEPAWPHTFELSRTLGIHRPVSSVAQSARKVRDFKALVTLWSACDVLNLCIFASAPTRLLSLDDISRLVRAVTGWETSSYEFMRWGERRLHLLRIYNLREGLTAADDLLPDRFFDEPIDAGRFAGARLDRNAFRDAIDLYYASMGWDAAGVPTPATRYDHHLEWTLEEVPTS
ncbi:MAG: aldehyde ferredoxin oxidoreductase family protein [Acidimicrobiia bacterium]